MIELEVWWSPAAACWRIEDREMFTYYSIDLVVGHFVHRHAPAGALLTGIATSHHGALRRALNYAGVPFADRTEVAVS